MISGISTNFNLVGLQDVNIRRSIFTKILSSLGVDYKFAKNFRFSSNLGVDYNYYDEYEWYNPDFGDGASAHPLGLGSGTQSDNNYAIWNWSNLVHYSTKLGENGDHEINLSLEQKQQIEKINNLGYGKKDTFHSTGILLHLHQEQMLQVETETRKNGI